MFLIGMASFVGRVVIDVDNIIEHSHGRPNGLLQHLHVQLTIDHMLTQVDGPQVTDCRFVRRRIQKNLGTQIAAVHNTTVILRRTQVGRVFPCDPRMTCLKDASQHLTPQFHGRQSTKHVDLAFVSQLLVVFVAFFKGFADKIVQIRHVVRTE